MALLPKPWEVARPAAEQPKPKTDAKGRWLPGTSGNPAGKPKGAYDKRTHLQREMIEGSDEVVAVVMQKAKEGDLQAAALVLSRVAPPLRGQAATVEFDFDPSQPVASQATQIMVAISQGRVDPHTGKMLFDCLAAHVGLKDIETFLDELHRLRDAKRDHIQGGVKEYDPVSTPH